MPTTPNCGMGGSTLTVAEIRTALEGLPDDMPVTITLPDGSWWLNISEVHIPRYFEEAGHYEEPSVQLNTRDDFDTRQF